MVEWTRKTLGQVCTTITVGHVGSMASQYVSRGVPFLRSQNVRVGRLDFDGLKYISRDFHEKLSKSSLQANDIVIVRTGTPGAAALVPEDLGDLNCSDIVIARPDHGVDPWFLCYAINATAREYVRAHTVGAVQQHFNVASARSLQLGLPSLSSQRVIAAVLRALDDKIAVNQRIATTSDDLRHLMISKYLAEQDSAESMFPLSSIAQFINGRAFTKDATGAGRMVIRIAELNSGPGGSTVYNDLGVPERHLARPGEVLFAWSGSLTVARWFRPEAIVNQHIFKVVPNPGIPSWLAFELTKLKMEEFRRIAADKATTMGHIQRRHLDEPVMVPNESDLPQLDAKLGPLWDRALVAEQESLTIAQLRDTLLPKLMSGQLRVRDAEKVVEEAT